MKIALVISIVIKLIKKQSTKEENKNRDNEDEDNKITISALFVGTFIIIVSIFIAIKVFVNGDEWNE